MLNVFLAVAVAAAVDGDVIPKAQDEIGAACAASPPVSVLWDDFGEDESGAGALAASSLTFVSVAFTIVCKDEALKGEVGKQISKVVLRQARGATEPILYVSKGTLYIEYFWVANEPMPDATYVASELASRLRGEEAEAP
jgi:hypothetical protein